MKVHEILESTDVPTSNKEFDDKHPDLIAAAQKVKTGEMTNREYWKLVGKHRPVTKYKELPVSATDDDLRRGLKGNGQADKIGVDIPAGQKVHLRLDIPAYTRHNVWAPTIHMDKSSGNIGTSISHRATAIIDNPTMHIEGGKDVTNKLHPINIANGDRSKYPLATITGYWVPATTEEARAEANSVMNDPQWIQVGMDPRRHSFFYNRENRRPVVSGSRALQIGGLIFLKDPKYAMRSKFTYETSIDEVTAHMSTDPDNYGTSINSWNAKERHKVKEIPMSQLITFEHPDKMKDPKSKQNMMKIAKAYHMGEKIPPIMVKRHEDKYMVLDGHHRFFAAKLAGIRAIPAIVIPDDKITID